MSSIKFSEFNNEVSKRKRLNDFKRGYEKLSDADQKRFYERYLKYYPIHDENKIMAMNEVRRNKALLQQNNNPVHYNNHTTKVIYVKTLAGQSMTFDFTENLTVGKLKENIKENKLLDCDTDYQKLFILPDTVLDDDSRTLASYGVTSEATIELFCNMKYLKPANDKFVFNSNMGELKNGMCISPDSQYIYVPSDNREAQIYVINTSDGSIKKTINLRSDSNPFAMVDAVYLSPDGTSFFVTGYVSYNSAYNSFQKRLTSNQQCEYTSRFPNMQSGRSPLSGICISPNGDSIFITDAEYAVIRVFDASNGEYMHSIGKIGIEGTGEGEFNGLRDICMSQTGELFTSEYYNDRVQVFNARDRTFNRMFKTTINGEPFGFYIMDVSPDGKYLYVAFKNKIHVLDTSNGLTLDTIIVDMPYNSNIKDVCVSPDGNFLFVLLNGLKYNSKIVKYAVFGGTAYSTMGGKRYKKKGIRQKRSKNRARYSKKRGTKRKQRK